MRTIRGVVGEYDNKGEIRGWRTRRERTRGSGFCGIGLWLAAAALGGCGGGGSSGSDATPASSTGPAATTPGASASSAGTASTAFSIGGSVSGLSGTVVLQDNGGDALSISTNGSFTFPTRLSTGSAYAVTVSTQPGGQTCAVGGGSGTVTAAGVSSVTVSCAANAAPSSDLVAFAATYAALRIASALPVAVLIAEGMAPCGAGSVSIIKSPFQATYSACAAAIDADDAFSGGLSTSSIIVGLGSSALHGLTITSAALGNVTATLQDASIFATAGLSGSTLQETLSLSSFAFKIGSASSYQLGTYTIGSPQVMTRVQGSSGVTSTIPAAAGSVTYNNGAPMVMTLLTPIVWQDNAITPTAGSLQIRSGTSLALQVQFLSGGQFRLSDTLTGASTTKSWTDADIQAALHSVTQ